MSRSYKRTPRSGDKKDKFFKRYENHRLRKLPFVGISFEKYWCSLKRRFHNKPEILGTKEEAYREYIKWFIRK